MRRRPGVLAGHGQTTEVAHGGAVEVLDVRRPGTDVAGVHEERGVDPDLFERRGQVLVAVEEPVVEGERQHRSIHLVTPSDGGHGVLDADQVGLPAQLGQQAAEGVGV